MVQKENRTLTLTSRQSKIYDGLQSFSPQSASLYFDGIFILSSSSIQSKSILVAHCAREINSRIREVFGNKSQKKELAKKLSERPQYKSANTKELASILTVLDSSEPSEFAEDWHNAVSKLHKYAHGDREIQFSDLEHDTRIMWEKFEQILFLLFGNFFAVQSRLVRMLKYEYPTDEIKGALPNLLKNPIFCKIFFSTLSHTGWLRPLNELGFLSPSFVREDTPVEDNPGWVRPANWPPGIYLLRISELNLKRNKPRDNISNLLLSIIDEFIDFKKENGLTLKNRNLNYDLVRIMFYLPSSLLSEKHFSFLSKILKKKDSLVSWFILDEGLTNLLSQGRKNPILHFLRIIFTPIKVKVKTPNDEYEDYQNLIYENSIESHLFQIPDRINQIVDICGLDAFFEMQKILRNVSDERPGCLNRLTRVNFSGKSSYYQTALELPVFFATATLEHFSGELKSLIEKLYKSELPVFRRIAIHIVKLRFEKLKNVIFDEDINLFEFKFIPIELNDFLKERSADFNETECLLLSKWIEELSMNWLRHSFPDSYEEEIVHRKRCLFELLKNVNNKLIQNQLREWRSKDSIPFEERKDSALINIGVMETPDVDISQMDISEIVELSEEYEKKSLFKWGNIEFKNQLNESILKKPERYFEHLDKLPKTSISFLEALVESAGELHKKASFLYWGEFLNFITQLIHDQPKIFKDKSGVVIDILRLLKKGMEKDETAFDLSLMPSVREIILLMKDYSSPAEKINEDWEYHNRDYSLLIETFIVYCLRFGRNHLKNEEVRWENDMKQLFINEFLVNPTKELHYWLGRYFPQINYLDKHWVRESLDYIFPDDGELWRITFSAYLRASRINKIYGYLYNLLKSHGDYSRAIKDDELLSDKSEYLIEHIMLAYEHDLESLDIPSGLLTEIFNVNNPEIYSAILNYYSRKSGQPSQQQKHLAIRLWEKILKTISADLDKKRYQNVCGQLLLLIPYLDRIDEEKIEWIFRSISFMFDQVDMRSFFNSLLRFVSDQTEEVIKIVLESGKKYRSNYYMHPKYLEDILIYLYNNDYIKDANEIVHLFGKKGVNLDSIYRKYNKL